MERERWREHHGMPLCIGRCVHNECMQAEGVQADGAACRRSACREGVHCGATDLIWTMEQVAGESAPVGAPPHA